MGQLLPTTPARSIAGGVAVGVLSAFSAYALRQAGAKPDATKTIAHAGIATGIGMAYRDRWWGEFMLTSGPAVLVLASITAISQASATRRQRPPARKQKPPK